MSAREPFSSFPSLFLGCLFFYLHSRRRFMRMKSPPLLFPLLLLLLLLPLRGDRTVEERREKGLFTDNLRHRLGKKRGKRGKEIEDELNG